MHPLQLSVLIIVKTDIEKVVNRKIWKNRNYYTNTYKISHFISVIIVISEFIEKSPPADQQNPRAAQQNGSDDQASGGKTGIWVRKPSRNSETRVNACKKRLSVWQSTD
jgi:hypothetical protein